jgi:IclR family acetate operon transcriptional repressor
MALHPGDGTGSLEKAIDVLEEIGRQPGGISHNDLAERIGMPRTTVYRLLATLVARGLVRRDPSRRMYCLGLRCFEFARQAYAMPDMVAAATQELRDLRDLTGETSYIGALEGLDVVSLERYDSAHGHRSSAGLGHRKPAYATSQGKAILAALDNTARDALVAALTLKPLTPGTITDRRRLQAELRATRARGWAIDDEENVPGVRCVGAAVIDLRGNVCGAISVAGPAYRLPHSRLELLGPEIAEAARRIGARLEGHDPAHQDASVTPTSAAPALFGAFPRWCARRQRLIWVDTLAPAMRNFGPRGDDAQVRVERPVTGMFLRGEAICLVDDEGAVQIEGQHVRQLEVWRPMRIQALDTDADNEVWVALESAGGSVIGRIGSDGGFRRKWELSETVQTLRWHGSTLYAAAPGCGAIFMMTLGSSMIRRLASVSKGSGVLSGLEIDAEGGVWTALRDGWSVVRFRADGSFDRSVPLPVPYPTGVAIGGAAMDRLFVTTARQPVALDTLKSAPLSGRLFEVALTPASAAEAAVKAATA